MKKISLLIVTLVMAIGVKAQGSFILPVVGLNESGALLYGTYFNNGVTNVNMAEFRKMIVGLSAGVKYRYEYGNPFLIEVGVYYNQYGYALNDVYREDTRVLWNQKVRYHHFSVPIMFGYKFAIGRDGIFLITPKIGVQIGYYTNLNQKYTYLNENNETIDFVNNGPIENGVDIAENIEVEFGWRLTRRYTFYVSIGQRYSFRNMFYEKDYENTVYTVEKDSSGTNIGNIFNYSFSTNAGLRIKLGKIKNK